MDAAKQRIYNAIDEILWNGWDPIGVNDNDDARDEYQSYTPTIFQLKMNGAGIYEIAEYLSWIETIRMGMTGNWKHCKEIAEKIFSI
jgi:hypothetical protein